MYVFGDKFITTLKSSGNNFNKDVGETNNILF
jgi:hypothetical protein